MRSIDSAALAKLTTQYGNEPVTIIEIQWVDGGQRFQYADKAIPSANIPGKIIQMGDLDDVAIITGVTQSTTPSTAVDIVLDDIDGAIKQIVDNNDIHLRPCWVYQWFEGLDINDKFLLFKGEINTPITWKEGDRSITFTVISQVEDNIVGFSIEQGNFFVSDPSLIGRAWPLCFGTVTNVPCTQLTPTVVGTLGTGTGIADPSIPIQIYFQEQRKCPLVTETVQGVPPTITTGGGVFGGGLTIQFNNQKTITDPSCLEDICNTISALQSNLAEQQAYQTPTITVLNGERFPQNTPLVLAIGGAHFAGSFSGETFTITDRVHPNKIYKYNYNPAPQVFLPPQACQQWEVYREQYAHYLDDSNYGPLTDRGTWDAQTAYQLFDMVEYSIDGIPFQYMCNSANVGFPPTDSTYWSQLPHVLAFSESYIDFYNQLAGAIPSTGFFWAEAGSEVTVVGLNPITHIANILPSTVLRVCAYRQFAAGPALVTVPPEYYNVEIADYTGYQMTQITLPIPLSAYGDGWEDDLYVTLTSSVGPNTVDILTWIIQTYSQHSIDSTSFDAVKLLVDNYPMHFALLELKDLQTIVKDIAYQARCAIMLDDDTFKLVYLSQEPTPVDTISDSDILLQPNSLELYHTPTEDLVTQYTVTYKDDYAVAEPYTLIYRYNVNKYRLQKASDDFYCYNILSLVRKSASFWLQRRANTWKLVRCSTPLTKLNIEVGDCVTLNLAALSSQAIKAIVTKAAYNSNTYTIDFEFWTPLRSGETTPYIFAWPAGISEQEIFPTPNDLEKGYASGGPGPNFITVPPLQLIGGGGGGQAGGGGMGGGGGTLDCNGQFVRFNRLSAVLDPGDFPDGQCHNDRGQQKPSDKGDTKPTPKTSTDSSDVQGGSSPGSGATNGSSQSSSNCCQAALKAAQDALAQANKALAAAGGGGQGQQGNPDDPNDLTGKVPNCNNAKKNNSCTFTINVTYSTASEVFSAEHGFSTKPGDSGTTLTQSSSTRTSSTVFAAEAAAEEFLKTIQAQINALLQNGPYVVGQEAMTAVARGYTPGSSDSGQTDCGNTASKQILGYCRST